MTPMTLTACGVRLHDDDCLCDVHISTPVEVRYGFDQVWGADVVQRATGWDGETGGDALAAFLESLAYGYDATRQMADFDTDWDNDGGVLRKQVLELLAGGVSIIDIPNIVGDSFARIVNALTDGQPSPIWTWDERTWAEWEDAVRDVNHTPYTLMLRFGLKSERVTRRLMEKYNIDPNGRGGVKRERLNRIKQMLREGHDVIPIRDTLIAEGLAEGKNPRAIESSIRRVRDNNRF